MRGGRVSLGPRDLEGGRRIVDSGVVMGDCLFVQCSQ